MRKLIVSLIVLSLLFSCSTRKEILYLQDVQNYNNESVLYTNAQIQPNDVLKIDVSALVPESAEPYNMRTGNNQGGANLGFLQLEGYLVSDQYTINFPILGVLSVKEQTTVQFAEYLRNKLVNDGHLKNPTVNVRLVNAKVTILGEVNQPGTFTFAEQNITLLQALGYAGDLTINGKREDVVLIRDEKGVRQVTHIDLTQSDWLNGPYNFIKPNDVIIVNPNGPQVKRAGFIGDFGTALSVVSILFTSIVLITR